MEQTNDSKLLSYQMFESSYNIQSHARPVVPFIDYGTKLRRATHISVNKFTNKTTAYSVNEKMTHSNFFVWC